MKLQILVNDQIVQRIDRLAAYVGQSRSAVCASILVKALPEWEKIIPPGEGDEGCLDDLEYDQIMLDLIVDPGS